MHVKKQIGMEARANGKINLYLDVLTDGQDGFHEITSVMQSVSLCDRVIVSAARGSMSAIRIECDLPYVPCDERNIAHRAATMLLVESGITAEVFLRLQKRIPVAGGMAGGSTDAAAVLSALNRLLGAPLTNERLLALAAKLGSDVPFCLLGKTALCEGRGEKLTPIENHAKLLLLIVPSGESVSTPWAYGELDARFGDFAGRREQGQPRLDRLKAALAAGDTNGVVQNMYNVFEEVILQKRPLAMRAKELLLEGGAIGAMMSGSGPTVFGVFADTKARQKATELLKKNGYHPKTAESIL